MDDLPDQLVRKGVEEACLDIDTQPRRQGRWASPCRAVLCVEVAHGRNVVHDRLAELRQRCDESLPVAGHAAVDWFDADVTSWRDAASGSHVHDFDREKQLIGRAIGQLQRRSDDAARLTERVHPATA